MDKPVSRILFGTAMQPFQSGGDGKELLDEMFSLGINTFDTARVYGGSEKSLGEWIRSRNLRNKVVIFSKGGHPAGPVKRISEKAIRRDLETSLEELGTDYIDIYLLHRDDEKIPAGEIVEWLNALHKEGKIGAFGGSNWTHERIARANDYAKAHGLLPFTASSPYLGLADSVCDVWGGCVSAAGPSGAKERAWYRQTQMPLIAYSAMARGFFSGKFTYATRDSMKKVLDRFAVKGYASEENFERLKRAEELAAQKGATAAQISLAWLYHQDINAFAAISTSSKERMSQNIAALSLELTKEECAWLNLGINNPDRSGM